MTDIPGPGTPVPSRLGVTARYEDGELVLDLAPRPETLHHGVVRASVLSFLVDAAAGIPNGGIVYLRLNVTDDLRGGTSSFFYRLNILPNVPLLPAGIVRQRGIDLQNAILNTP